VFTTDFRSADSRVPIAGSNLGNEKVLLELPLLITVVSYVMVEAGAPFAHCEKRCNGKIILSNMPGKSKPTVFMITEFSASRVKEENKIVIPALHNEYFAG